MVEENKIKLIYTDENFKRLGELKHYEADIDVIDSKDFEIKTILDNDVLVPSGYWYIDNTEYGGKIKNINPNTETNIITYIGPTFRGMLNNKCIEPPASEDYKIVTGNVDDIINDFLMQFQLSDFFKITSKEQLGSEYKKYVNLIEQQENNIISYQENIINCNEEIKASNIITKELNKQINNSEKELEKLGFVDIDFGNGNHNFESESDVVKQLVSLLNSLYKDLRRVQSQISKFQNQIASYNTKISTSKNLITSYNTKISELIKSKDAGYVYNYQFDRYCSFCDGISAMLSSIGMVMKLKFNAKDKKCYLTTTYPIDYSNKTQLSNKDKLYLNVNKTVAGCNHLICLGKGDLKDRQVYHWYIGKDGKPTTKKYYTGLNEITEVYDNSSIEDLTELIQSGKKKIVELASQVTAEINMRNIDYDIGDIIGGYEEHTKIKVKKPIKNIIVKIENDICKLEYKLEGESI